MRYVVAPVVSHLDADDAATLQRYSRPVYEDQQVRILENTSAFPRAWNVHAAARVDPDEALRLIGSGQVDARRTALIEDTPPPVEVPTNPSVDQATVISDRADHIAVRTDTDADGLLVLSEIYYPAWKAYVDGQPVQMYVADEALRAVAAPSGEHIVELRFESTALTMGIVISGVAALFLVAIWLASLLVSRPTRLGQRLEHP